MSNSTIRSKVNNRLLLLAIFFSSGQVMVLAQQHEVKLSIVNLIRGEAKLYYEYHINESWSTEIGVGHQKRKFDVHTLPENLLLRRPKSFNRHQLGFDFTLKYFISKKIPNSGIYIGPRYSFYEDGWVHPNIENIQKLVSIDDDFERGRYGGTVGLKLPVVNRLLFELESSLLFSRKSRRKGVGQIKMIYRIGKP